ncbi:MAG: YdeI/OmpD-associated family protein [Deltaproteobacteria bacterium]|nr:YdeI/OmpD-associated family protein [Deltaproteobacteria bacterium]
MPARERDERPEVEPNTRAAWRAWLAKNHARSTGVWLVLAKRSGAGLGYAEAVEEALCFGWIDSRTQAIDETRYRLVMSPRKPKSAWAQSNRARVERLVAEGRMTAAGLAKIEAAKADGSWTALDAIDALVVPDDLRSALRKDAIARRHFEAFSPSVKKMILYWIASAKREETRRRRVEQTVAHAAKNAKPIP